MGLRVRLRGAGVNRVATTNANGVLRASIRANRAGTLRINVLDTLVMDGCSTSRRVAAAPRPRRGGNLGGGAGLTGRAR